jgi:hypothetical protein
MRQVIYVAHPVRPAPGRPSLEDNLSNVKAWLRWLFAHDPDRAYIAPWVAEVEGWIEAGQAEDPAIVEKALGDDEAVVAHCDGIIMVGGFGVTSGMARERTVNKAHGHRECDWTAYRTPTDLPEGATPWPQ